MPWNSEPTTPIDVYKAIVDQLVEETTPGISERLIRESGVYSNSPSDAAANALVKSLSADQRKLLAEMLHEERVSAIHGVLSNLTWWMGCREVGLTFRGQPMPFELSGEGIHGDYIGRMNDWQWPKDDITPRG